MNQVYHTANNLYINPTYIVSVPEFSGNVFERSVRQKENEVNLKDNKHKGGLSIKAQSKMRNAINWLCVSAKEKRVWSRKDNKSFWFKVSFITLTIPPQERERITNYQLKKVLHAWLVYAQKYYYLKNYVWKVEAHKDGRCHIHISSDTFIHFTKVKKSWNKLLKSKGMLDYHYKKYNNYEPNSTDIHSVKNVNNMAAYMVEYMIKKAGLDEDYTGRIWSCNYALSSKNKCQVNITTDLLSKEMRTLYSKKIRCKTIKVRDRKTGIEKNVADLFFMTRRLWKELKGTKVYEAYQSKKFKIRNSLPDIPPEYFYLDQILSKPKNEETCETKNITQKIGPMSSGQASLSGISLNVKNVELNIGKQLLLGV